VFSTFLNKELATAKNIKNRVNRLNVIRLLKKIQNNVLNSYKNGVLIYCGIDEYKKEIFEIIEPEVECNIFYYNCGNKFNTEFIKKFSKNYDGNIIFVNGNETFIYNYNGSFKKSKHINGNLVKRHKKGGQSQKRFERLAEESRIVYVNHIIDYLNELNSNKNWIFGSDEILNLILKNNNLKVKLNNGGFLNFNNETINDTDTFLNYLKLEDDDKNNIIFEKIVFYLDTDPDYLDFEPNNFNEMKFFITKIKDENMINSEKCLKLNTNNKYYERLHIFDYIGLKYYNY
jgi:hypothetical protein